MPRKTGKPRMAYWSSPAALGGRVERYGVRRVMRMGLMELGLPAAFVFPFVMFLFPIITMIVQQIVQAQVQAEVAAALEKERKQREALLREAYRGIIPE